MSSLILVRWNPDKKVTPPWRKFPPAAAGVSTGIFWQGDLQCHCVMTGFSELSPSRSPEREPPGVPHLPSYGKSRLPGRGFLLYQGSSPQEGLSHVSLENSSSQCSSGLWHENNTADYSGNFPNPWAQGSRNQVLGGCNKAECFWRYKPSGLGLASGGPSLTLFQNGTYLYYWACTRKTRTTEVLAQPYLLLVHAQWERNGASPDVHQQMNA